MNMIWSSKLIKTFWVKIEVYNIFYLYHLYSSDWKGNTMPSVSLVNPKLLSEKPLYSPASEYFFVSHHLQSLLWCKMRNIMLYYIYCFPPVDSFDMFDGDHMNWFHGDILPKRAWYSMKHDFLPITGMLHLSSESNRHRTYSMLDYLGK